MRPRSVQGCHAAADAAPCRIPTHPPTHTLAPSTRATRLPQYAAGDARLQRVLEDCLAREGVLLALARYSKLERARPPPSIRCAAAGGQHSGAVLGGQTGIGQHGSWAVWPAWATYPPLSSIRRVAVTAAHTDADLKKAVAAIKASCKRVLG